MLLGIIGVSLSPSRGQIACSKSNIATENRQSRPGHPSAAGGMTTVGPTDGDIACIDCNYNIDNA